MFKNVPALQIFNQFCAYISVNTILYLICVGTFSEVGTAKHIKQKILTFSRAPSPLPMILTSSPGVTLTKDIVLSQKSS